MLINLRLNKESLRDNKTEQTNYQNKQTTKKLNQTTKIKQIIEKKNYSSSNFQSSMERFLNFCEFPEA